MIYKLLFTTLVARAAAEDLTCGDVKALYKDQSCCGQPSKPVGVETVDVVSSSPITTAFFSSFLASDYEKPNFSDYATAFWNPCNVAEKALVFGNQLGSSTLFLGCEKGTKIKAKIVIKQKKANAGYPEFEIGLPKVSSAGSVFSLLMPWMLPFPIPNTPYKAQMEEMNFKVDNHAKTLRLENINYYGASLHDVDDEEAIIFAYIINVAKALKLIPKEADKESINPVDLFCEVVENFKGTDSGCVPLGICTEGAVTPILDDDGEPTGFKTSLDCPTEEQLETPRGKAIFEKLFKLVEKYFFSNYQTGLFTQNLPDGLSTLETFSLQSFPFE